MKAVDALATFLAFAAARGYDLEHPTPQQAVDAMMDFYADVRADECDLSNMGDMLLFQWGTCDWGDGAHFEYDITRQLIFPDEDSEEPDDASPREPCIWQLRLTLLYEPVAPLRAVRDGNYWCKHPQELPTLREFIASCPSTVVTASYTPLEVTLQYGDAE